MIVVVYQCFVVLFRWIRRLSSFRVDVLGHLHFRFGSGSRHTSSLSLRLIQPRRAPHTTTKACACTFHHLGPYASL
uniref:Putative secreted protein n=1 Tax=Anopheles triannulatus TaxID=58253 RepID=A0A2M4B3S7_9DIPT